MADRLTIWRFYHPANLSLLGDGQKVSVIGWTKEESLAGIDLDVLGGKENEVARVAYVFHSGPDDPAALVQAFEKSLGFVPELTESETLFRSEIVPQGAREDWFDVFDRACQADDQVYVLLPGSDRNRERFRLDTRETLYL